MRARNRVAVIDEARCVGCTRCIRACPVDAIVGADQLMHTVVAAWCIGCDLCLPACPVDCIDMQPAPAGRPWTPADARGARERATRREARWHRATAAPVPADAAAREKRRAALNEALARSRARRASRAGVKS